MRVIDRGEGWVVLAVWYGRETVVYGPTSVFDATQWAARQ